MSLKGIDVVLANIDDIKPNPNNPRTITDEKHAKLVKSIIDFPEMLGLRPIVVDSDGMVLGGNMRLSACRTAGLEKVPVIYAKHLPKEKYDEFIAKDNIGFGEWDWEELSTDWDVELLGEWGLDFPAFDEEDQDEEPEETTGDDSTPELSTEPPENIVGDVWELGKNRLVCGDSTSHSDVEKLMNGDIANLVFTDPPYGINYSSNYTNKYNEIKNDDTFLDGFIPHVFEFSTGFVFVWTSYKVVAKWIEICSGIGDLTNMVIWDKCGSGMGDLKGSWRTDFEIALVYNRGEHIKKDRIGSIWKVSRDNASDYVHPTQKPVELCDKALENASDKGDIVLDLFGGSGSTLISSEKM